jgi:hypothetical protein
LVSGSPGRGTFCRSWWGERTREPSSELYSIGRACLDLELFGPKVPQALGLPLSVTGKSPFFDRQP